jgi:DNA ligase-1
MSELLDGQSVEIQGSAAKPYTIKNIGGVYSCTCPAWRHQSASIDRRSCKHLRSYVGDQAENIRLGQTQTASPAKQIVAEPNAAVAPLLLLAHSWDHEQDLTGWYMSEKLDGVRAYWTGSGFVSRNGNQFFAPTWFTEGFPTTPLDGELWIGRKKFQQTVSIVRRQDAGDLWKKVLYVVFDAPAAGGTFENRMKAIRESQVEYTALQLRVLYQSICEGTDSLRAELARVERVGGEGLMLRQPDSLYEAGRSSTLLKVKSFHDADAVVVGHQPGKGRHRGRLGALLVALANGTQFSVGTGFSDAHREKPPLIGSVITFRYQELTDGGVPRFPSFVRERRDVPSKQPGLLPLG